MAKKIILQVLIIGFVLTFSTAVFAQETDEVLPDAGLTPASPLHIFERFSDWTRLNLLTFNAVRKAEVKVEIAEKRLAELKAVVESGAESAVVERAEGFARVRAEAAEGDLERLDTEGRNLDSLIAKFNDLSLKQQSVLEGVLDKAPEHAREALNRALESSRKGLDKSEEVLKRQVEKNLIKQEKAKELLENNIERLKKQLERRSEHLEEIAEKSGEIPPELKERFETKLKILEDRLVNVESRDELKEVRKELKEGVKDAASTIIKLRARHELKNGEGDELLRDIERDRFDVAEKAKRAMVEAEKSIIELKDKIARYENDGKAIPQNVKELLANAEDHLKKSREAFDAKNFGEALGQANSSLRNSNSAKKSLEEVVKRSNESVKKPELRADKKSETVSKPVAESPASVVVKITGNGFEPLEVKIKKGGSVVWVNESGLDAWPASAVHPTHGVYPQKGGCLGSAFDACRRLADGEKYEFRFDHVGAWKYHNHLNPSMTGAVTVVE